MEMKPIVIVGCGPGSSDYICPHAMAAIETAELFVAAPHLQALFPNISAQRIVVETDIDVALNAIERHRDAHVVVGVSGDPGIASLCRNVVERFGRLSCRIIPGISSVQVAFARLGIDWTAARIVNAHRAPPPQADRTLGDADVIAVLAGRGSRQWIIDFCRTDSSDWRIFVCEDLTLDNERITSCPTTHTIPEIVSTRTIVVLVKRHIL